MTLIVLLLVLGTYTCFWRREHVRPTSLRILNETQLSVHSLHLDRGGSTNSGTSKKNVNTTSGLLASPTKSWQFPLMDRLVLDKLDRIHEFMAQVYGPYPLYDDLETTTRIGPPLVTRIPELAYRPVANKLGVYKTEDPTTLCESERHPRPCQFILPVRITEQESKARIHFSQIAELARRLNRTVILPKVGKSKIGSCFKWPMEIYYDIPSLSDDKGNNEWFVDPEAFKGWLEYRDRRGRPFTSQMVTVENVLESRSVLRQEPVYANEDVTAYTYRAFGEWERNLPGCFSTKFPSLKLEDLPIVMSMNSATNASGKLTGNSVVEAFSSLSRRALDGRSRYPHWQPHVLVVDWELRHLLFPPRPIDQSLKYSAQMYELAERYASSNAYLVVHWRMETVDVAVLQECALALVDVLSQMLHDKTLAWNITTVWFASDYPYPIARRTPSGQRTHMIAKSGTFKDFQIRHEEAIETLREAFDEQGELERWKLTDFKESTANSSEVELFEDPGVMGILDKLVSIRANLFVSGSSKCSRRRYVQAIMATSVGNLSKTSSFTKQVIDARSNTWTKDRQTNLRNIVDRFG